MDQMLDSIVFGKELDKHLNAMGQNPFVQILQEQNLISQTIHIDECFFQNQHYMYKIISQLGVVSRRYSDFELLSEYLFKYHPMIIQMPLPPKENVLQFISSFIVENKSVIALRKQGFYRFLNDLRDKVKDDATWKLFLTTEDFSVAISDKSLVERMKYVNRLKSLGTYYLQPMPPHIKGVQQAVQSQVQQMQQILGHLELFRLNITLQASQEKITFENQTLTKVFNDKIIKITSFYGNDKVILTISGIITKTEQVLTLWQTIRQEIIEQLKSYEQLLNQHTQYISSTLQQL